MKTSFALKIKQAGFALAVAVLMLPVVAKATPAPTWTELVISPNNPVSAGTDVTLTGKLYSGIFDNRTSPLSNRILKIEMLQSGPKDDPYNPALGVACDTAGGEWHQVPPDNEVTGSGSYPAGQVIKTFGTAGLEGRSLCFRTNHSAAGGDYAASRSGGMALVIGSGSCERPTLTNTQVSGGPVVGGSAYGPWQITMRLNNCLSVAREFKVQGGANAWAPLNLDISNPPIVVTAGGYEVKGKNKNSVIVWTVTTDAASHQDITFTVGTESSVLPCGGLNGIVQYLTGPWSAAYSNPDTGLPAKSAYTDRATGYSDVCPAP